MFPIETEQNNKNTQTKSCEWNSPEYPHTLHWYWLTTLNQLHNFEYMIVLVYFLVLFYYSLMLTFPTHPEICPTLRPETQCPLTSDDAWRLLTLQLSLVISVIGTIHFFSRHYQLVGIDAKVAISSSRRKSWYRLLPCFFATLRTHTSWFSWKKFETQTSGNACKKALFTLYWWKLNSESRSKGYLIFSFVSEEMINVADSHLTSVV